MKIAYLDCASGISGDMTLGALVDAGADLTQIQAGIDSLGLPGCRLVRCEVKKQGFRATQIVVEHEPEHKHRHLHHIHAIIEASQLSPSQQMVAKRIFAKLAEAEAKVHGTTIEKVHFHEVGAVDSIADICGTAIGFDLLRIERVVASPVPTGCGFVEIAHGRCSIPAPATGELLRGIPLAPSAVQAELTTPTGAAILAALADGFGPLPSMTIQQIGYGAGQRDLAEQPNLLRLFYGETVESIGAADQVWIVETNLDDTSGELVGYALSRLWGAGALDVWTTPIQMKKNRPGIRLSVLAAPADVHRLEAVLFRETTTLGVRRWPVNRQTLQRRTYQVNTAWGPVAGVLAQTPSGPQFSPEYEVCRALAETHSVPLKDVFLAAQKAFDPAQI